MPNRCWIESSLGRIRIGIRPAIAAAAACCAWGASPVFADAPPADPIVAQALFEQARALMAKGQYHEACPKLAESQRRDPAGGTLLNLALCHELEGRTASAWSEFRDALGQAKLDKRIDRESFAREHIAVLEAKLSNVRVNVDRAGAGPTELTVDDAVLPPIAFRDPFPLDPGVHEIVASAPGKKSWRKRLTVRPGPSEEVLVIPPLEDEPAPGAPAAAPPMSAQPRAAVIAENDSNPGHPLGGRKVAGIAVAAAGVVAVGVGTYFGLRAYSKWNERNDDCAHGCNADAVAAGSASNRAAWGANIGFGVGLVALGVGGYLFLSKDASAHPPQASLRGSGIEARIVPGFERISIEGRW